MEMPASRTSGMTLLREYGLYHQTRLDGDKNLAGMAASWRKAQERLKAKVDAHDAAAASAMTAMAVRDGEDAALDSSLRAFYGALLAKTGNDRKSPLFDIYFPQGITAIANAPMEMELQKVSILLTKLAQEEDEALKSHMGPITAAMNNLAAAIDHHKAAHDAELQAYGLVEQEKVNWLDAYKFDHRTLVQMFYKDRKKPDSYFKPVPKAKKRNGNGDATPPAAKA